MMKQKMTFCLYVGVCALVLAPAAGLAGTASRGMGAAARVVPATKSDPRSGLLVHTILISSKGLMSRKGLMSPEAPEARPQLLAVPPRTAEEVRTLVAEAAHNYDVPTELVDSVIQVESNYNSGAVSPKGAQGLMQLMPATARRFGVTDIFDPKQNIEGGVRYLKFLQNTFKDDRLAIAAYNAGEGAVQKYGNNVPPYPETVSYVAKVGKRYKDKQKNAEAARAAARSKAEASPKPPEYRRLAQFVDADGKVFLSTQ